MSKTQTETKHRLLKISILRYNPQDPDSVPHMPSCWSTTIPRRW